MKITYLGHSVLLLENENHSVIIDPFITGNPHTSIKVEDIKVDTILVTHGHADHIGDAVELSKQNDAVIIAPVELAAWLEWQGAKVMPMHVGGSTKLPFGKVKLVEAIHGSSIIDDEKQVIINVGPPVGYLVTMDEKVIYHAGDTALYRGMKTLGELENIDVAFLPIGDHFTMGIDDAVVAAKWINAKQVIPMHYNTFPPIQNDPNEFVSKLENKNGLVMEANSTITLK